MKKLLALILTLVIAAFPDRLRRRNGRGARS